MKISRALLLGILAACGALVFELLFSSFFPENFEINFSLGSIVFLLSLAIIEESFKFLAIWKSLEKETALWQLISSSLLVGLGFSLSELAIKSLTFSGNVPGDNSPAFFFHIFSVWLMGFLIFKRQSPSKLFFILVILLASLMHLFLNLFLVHIYAY